MTACSQAGTDGTARATDPLCHRTMRMTLACAAGLVETPTRSPLRGLSGEAILLPALRVTGVTLEIAGPLACPFTCPRAN